MIKTDYYCESLNAKISKFKSPCFIAMYLWLILRMVSLGEKKCGVIFRACCKQFSQDANVVFPI